MKKIFIVLIIIYSMASYSYNNKNKKNYIPCSDTSVIPDQMFKDGKDILNYLMSIEFNRIETCQFFNLRMINICNTNDLFEFSVINLWIRNSLAEPPAVVVLRVAMDNFHNSVKEYTIDNEKLFISIGPNYNIFDNLKITKKTDQATVSLEKTDIGGGILNSYTCNLFLD